jgi:hypothetical protein
MSGKAKTAQKSGKGGLGPNDHGYKHEKPTTVKVLEFRPNGRGNLTPKTRFMKG